MKTQIVTVNNHLQKNYKYLLTEPKGECFDEGFTPQLTPKQMIDMGVFGGC